jgi:YteA family regulatory protein
MNPERAERFRRRLLERREQLIWTRERMAGGQLDQSEAESLGELSTYDNHPADVGTETWERSKDLALRARAGRALADVEAALARLADGTFGYCLRCGRPVEAERLEAIPETPYCRSCAGELEDAGRAGERRRPVEEEVLGTPFARSWRDQGDYAGFEGEDAWQAVARYGTSETPSDVPEAREYPDVVEDPGERRGAAAPVEEAVDEEGDVLDPGGRAE